MKGSEALRHMNHVKISFLAIGLLICCQFDAHTGPGGYVSLLYQSRNSLACPKVKGQF